MDGIDLGGHDLALRVLVGSHNYNLNTPQSDVDYKYFVWPTFDDLLSGKKFHKDVTSADMDYTVHDVRNLPDLFRKGNLNFLEILYSIRTTGDPDLCFYLKEHAHELSTSNIPVMYKACIGMSFEKEKLMTKDSPGRHESIAKYGYDVKSAHHALRVLDFLVRFHGTCRHGYDFKEAIWYDDGDLSRNCLLRVKNGEFSYDTVKADINDFRAMCEGYRSYYERELPNMEPYENLLEAINEMIKARLVKSY